MDANTHGGNAAVGDQAETLAEFIVLVEQLLSFRLGVGTEALQLKSQELKSLIGKRDQAVLQAQAIVIGKHYGRKSGIDGFGAESQMQFGGPLANGTRRIQVGAQELVHVRGKLGGVQLERMAGHLGTGIVGLSSGQAGLEKLAEGIQRIVPGVALIFDERAQGGDGRGIAIPLGGAVLNGSRQRRCVFEAPLGEEGAHFRLGMHARFHACGTVSAKSGAHKRWRCWIARRSAQPGPARDGFRPKFCGTRGCARPRTRLLVHESGVCEQSIQAGLGRRPGPRWRYRARLWRRPCAWSSATETSDSLALTCSAASPVATEPGRT